VISASLPLALQDLSQVQLRSACRDGGCTVRHGVHCLAAASMIGDVRTKAALAEELPQIPPFEINLWTELPDEWPVSIAQ
jgi:hypothetical protein